MKKTIFLFFAAILCSVSASAWSYKSSANGWTASTSGFKNVTMNSGKTVDVVMLKDVGDGVNICQNDNGSGHTLYCKWTKTSGDIFRGTARWNNGLYCDETVVVPGGKVYIKVGSGTQVQMTAGTDYTYTADVTFSNTGQSYTISGGTVSGATIKNENSMPSGGKPASLTMKNSYTSKNAGSVHIVFDLRTNKVTETAEEPEAPEPIETTTLYYVNSGEWSSVNAYVWVAESNESYKPWSGEAATKTDKTVNDEANDKTYDVYSYTFPITYNRVIFNGDGKQTQDAEAVYDAAKPYLCNAVWYESLDAVKDALKKPIPDETIYFINTGKWSKVMIYTWNGSGATSWPGVEMTKTSEVIGEYEVYSYTAKQGGQANLLFQESADVNKTGDLTWQAGKYYAPSKNKWYDTKEAAAEALAAPVEYEYVYLINTNDWAKAYIYTWESEVHSWPGAEMTKEATQIAGKDVYSYKVVKGTTFGGLNFNCGGDECKTGDLTWRAGKYYAPSKDKWYDTKEAAEEALATPVIDVYTIMGAGELGLSWDLATTGNDMTKQADGTYTLVKEGLDLATTGNYEYKVVKNHSWDWSIPTGTDNQTLKVDKDGTYTVTFTLSSDKKKLTADALCTAEKEVILDCSVAGTINLVGGTADFTDKLAMTYNEGTKTYSKTFTALAAGNYQMKVVYGSDWLGYDKLTQPVPVNVTEGDDKKIKFSLAEAGDVTVTYHATNGIGLTGNFAAPAPEAKKYYVKGTHNEWIADATSEMTLDSEVYKKEVTLAKDVEFKINDGADAWWGKDNLGGKSYNELEGLEGGNLKMKEAKTFTIIFSPTANLITFEGLTETTPAVQTITYVLMGVNGDWTTGIELTQNPDNANEYMLLNQTITRATDAIKVVTLTDGTATAWCGDVDEYSDAIYENNWDKDGNIELEDGIYNFYFKVSDKIIYIDQTTLLRTGTNKYGTIYIPYTPESVSGATFYQVAGKGTEDGQEGVYLESVDVVEAGKPYIYERTGNQVVKIVFSGEKATNGGAVNGLIGTDTKSTHVPVNNYILINNTFCKTDGSSKVRGYRAYLDLNAVTGDKPQPMPGRRYIGMSVQGENAATGLDNITNGENTTIKFIENGQLIIIRNGEKFNAQGIKL